MPESSRKRIIQIIWIAIKRSFSWTRSSYYLFSGFLALLLLIGYVWWPLIVQYVSTYNPEIPFWWQVDYLLLGNFLAMSLLIMANADIKKDWTIFVIGMFGGLVIESWGTQTEIWTYYTNERPPLWIVPAWPIASLSIDRLFRMLKSWTRRIPEKVYTVLFWLILPAFYILMLNFVQYTFNKSLTQMALFLCAFLILTEKKHRSAVLTFIAGAGLGYFLERWGTTRSCWTYYTYEYPPLFAVLAHGMAAVAFWRVLELYRVFEPGIMGFFNTRFRRKTAKGPVLVDQTAND
jgi:hypothetical protein